MENSKITAEDALDILDKCAMDDTSNTTFKPKFKSLRVCDFNGDYPRFPEKYLRLKDTFKDIAYDLDCKFEKMSGRKLTTTLSETETDYCYINETIDYLSESTIPFYAKKLVIGDNEDEILLFVSRNIIYDLILKRDEKYEEDNSTFLIANRFFFNLLETSLSTHRFCHEIMSDKLYNNFESGIVTDPLLYKLKDGYAEPSPCMVLNVHSEYGMNGPVDGIVYIMFTNKSFGEYFGFSLNPCWHKEEEYYKAFNSYSVISSRHSSDVSIEQISRGDKFIFPKRKLIDLVKDGKVILQGEAIRANDEDNKLRVTDIFDDPKDFTDDTFISFGCHAFDESKEVREGEFLDLDGKASDNCYPLIWQNKVVACGSVRYTKDEIIFTVKNRLDEYIPFVK